MEHTEIYDYFLSRVQADLSKYGYSRSGKGTLFYRYSADKKVACAIEMQKSAFNYPGSTSFTFNLLCVGIFELSGYSNGRLTVPAIRACLQNAFIAKRIGSLCRGRDYWWKITDEILNMYRLEEYYDRFIQIDIKKSAEYLDELAMKKGHIYR